jgi:hypothetical protein
MKEIQAICFRNLSDFHRSAAVPMAIKTHAVAFQNRTESSQIEQNKPQSGIGLIDPICTFRIGGRHIRCGYAEKSRQGARRRIRLGSALTSATLFFRDRGQQLGLER